ncbi:AAA family ATPase [Acinetobacter calcoaceticus]|uniref:AAA family ATPase n=1 Tax=Acinetobacter calcoaceticus TaxID=471 RepID=UPI00124EFF38|nr:AAA family ATPase [Acinetobacter calcoaceticus]
MKWKINRLEIRNFKAFEQISFNFDCATLLTLEGPNGFGKTTVYDALELVFTGRIERISRLCNEIMLSAQRNYSDNLFWNNKLREEDILIKLELINIDNNEKFVFARKAFVEDLKVIQNNKANNFDIFKIFLMKNYDDNNFVNKISQADIDEKLGDNFIDNYNIVNYLEQGQNQFVFSKNIKERKDSIKKLLNTEEISEIIKNCSDVERKISRKINSEKLDEKILDLENKIKEINMSDLNLGSDILYKRLSTSKEIPLWDGEFFNFFENSSIVSEVDEIFSQLLSAFEDNEKLNIWVKNKKNDDFIKKYSNHLVSIVRIGKYIGDYENLKIKSDYIKILNKALGFLSEKIYLITKEMLEEIKDLVYFDIDLFLKNNEILLKKQKIIFSSNEEIISINDARQKLINSHSNSNDKNCLLCDSLFDTHDLLISALDLKTASINANNNDALREIKSLEDIQILMITENKAKIKKLIDDIDFNKELFNELDLSKGSFSTLNQIMNWLRSHEIEGFDCDFTLVNSVVEQRYNDLILSIKRMKKEVDLNISTKCVEIFENSFEKIDDILLLNKSAVVEKFNYFKIKKNEFNNEQILKFNNEIFKIKQTQMARDNLKKKINILKTELSKLEKAYSKKIISEIELTFHIYSGRLIQNYQRGLGIFIDEGEGDRLRFCTAEQSAHDATLAMSSGQLSALSLAFFLSLNRVYANSPFILIDDPAQSLDDINIASLSDLLRCELKDRQLFLSSHEDDISAYLRFRFKRVGLTQKPFNIQKLNMLAT